MSLLAAATLGDDILHTPLLAQILKVVTTVGTGLLTGILIGAAAAAAAAFIIGTGGLGAVVLGAVIGAVIGVAADATVKYFGGGNSLDEAICKPICDAIDKMFPGVVKGKIVTGSINVKINSLPAARAAGKTDPAFPARQAARQAELEANPPSLLDDIGSAFVDAFTGLFGSPPEQDFGFIPTLEDRVLCQDHHPLPDQYIAEGSSSVFFNSQPAARVQDKTTCDAKISISPEHAPTRNVTIGGEKVQVRSIQSEMPPWLDRISRYAGLAIGLCQAIRGKGPLLNKLLCFGTNFAISVAADAVVRGSTKHVSGMMGHPVHIPTGTKILDGEDDQDFTLAAHLPLDWTRYYNASNRRAGMFGTGWSVLYDLELRLHHPTPDAPEACHQLIDLQGRAVGLPALELNQKYFVAEAGFTFARTEGGHYLISFTDGLILDFGTPSQPLAGAPEQAGAEQAAPAVLHPWVLEDRNGNAHYLRRDAQQRLVEIFTSCSQQLSFDYDEHHPQRLRSIHQLKLGAKPTASQSEAEGPPNRRLLVQYSYDDQGRLAAVFNPQGDALRQFAYDSDSRMTMQQLPQGMTVHYQWGAVAHDDQSRVVAYQTSAGEEVRIQYELAADGSGYAHTEDNLGRRHAWHWDPLKRITQYVNPVGGSFDLNWDPVKRQLLSITNPNGGKSCFAYDERDNLIQETDPLGRQRNTQWLHELAEPVEQVGFEGERWEWRYDGLGNCVEENGPYEQKYTWVRDRHGAIIIQTDPRYGQSYYHYDPQGRLTRHTDCSHRSTDYQYDAWGQLVQQTDAAGHTTRYGYSEAGQLERITDADGSERTWRQRPDGGLLSYSHGDETSQYEWDPAGRLAAHLNPIGAATRWQYDRGSRVVDLCDGKNQHTRFEYDHDDRLIAETGIDGLRTEYRHDPAGQIIGVTQAAGREDAISLDLQRDELGRLISKTTPETLTRYQYDGADRITCIQRYARSPKADEALLPIDEIQYAYDLAQRTVTETSLVYRLLQDSNEPGLPAQWKELPEPRRSSVQNVYDVLGNPIQTTLPGGQTLKHLYYGSGHLHQILLGDRVISDFERDEIHREISRTQGNLRSDFTLDPMGRLLDARAHMPIRPMQPRVTRVRILPEGDTVHKHYSYTATGHLSQKHDSALGEQRFQHDKAGQVQRVQYPQSAHLNPASLGYRHEERFDWDDAGNALPAEGSQGRIENNRVTVWQDIRFHYDSHGRLIRKEAGKRSTTHLTWNTEHQLIHSHTQRQGASRQSVRYHYDALGRRIAKTDRFGTTWFVWDGMKMMQEQRGQHCITTIYEDPASYAPLARVEHDSQETEIPAERVFYFHTDVNGAPEELTSAYGHVIWRARYRTWGNTVLEEWDREYAELDGNPEHPSEEHKRQQNLRFQGQYFDSETGLHYNTFRYYDPDIGRFISQDPIGLAGGMNLYQYAPNPMNWIDPAGLASVPSYPDLVHMATHTLDFSTAKNGAVFWSGGNMRTAQNWAAKTGRTTLEQTTGGKYLDSLKLFGSGHITDAQAAHIWDIASKRFADGASGKVRVFSTGAKKIGAYGLRTWWRIEKPALLANKKVTGITRMKKNGTPAKC